MVKEHGGDSLLDITLGSVFLKDLMLVVIYLRVFLSLLCQGSSMLLCKKAVTRFDISLLTMLLVIGYVHRGVLYSSWQIIIAKPLTVWNL